MVSSAQLMCLLSAGGVASAFSGNALFTSVAGCFVVCSWLLAGGARTLYLAYHTLPRDLRAAWMVLRLLVLAKKAERRNWTVPKMFTETARRLPDKAMLLFEGERWTFRDIEEYSNRVGHFFLERGYAKGDSIALFMENRPEYVALWLGLAKIGVVPALINYNLRQESLIHSISAVKCRAIIYSVELSDAVRDVISTIKNGSLTYPTFCSGCNFAGHVVADESFAAEDLDSCLHIQPTTPVGKDIQDSIGFNDRLLFIYTSGTTGMPKAAVIKHSRYILASGGSHIVFGCKLDDVVYSPLPLYHSVAGMISLSGAMNYGITLVMKRKFSASAYWADCVKYRVTAAQYIGEMCRYLLNTPESPEEKRHSVRLMFGNGLRPQIWRGFVERFGIPNIAEFYGSTEGNSQIINRENRVGAVGFVSVLFPTILPLGLIRVDEETGRELRGRDGLCVRCKAGEPGEFVGLIVRNHPVRDFHGYADSSSTEKKLLSNVWKEGDLCFRSGDLLVMDEFGWLYFRDRAGDTFRWKGENVSTTEVEAVVSNLVQLKDAAAYGVEVPGCEGKAGMVAIHDPDGEVDLLELASGLAEKLPSYARPLFVRLVQTMEVTGTFKLMKFNFQREGFDPVLVPDKLFFWHPKSLKYERMDDKLFRDIVANSVRL